MRSLLARNKWLLARRASQAGFLALFLSGPLLGVWITKGTLASSLTLDLLPLTEPLVAVQSLLAGHWLETSALVGAGLLLAAWLLLGRVFCSWVCPINLVADAAHWLRRRLGIKDTLPLSRGTRYWVLGGVLLTALASGTIAWEFVNPVTLVHRGLVFGTLFTAGLGLAALAAVALFELAVEHGWCGRLCPMGAFYALTGVKALPRVSAENRDQCDDCLDCFKVCPEPHVISPALRGAKRGLGPMILNPECTTCGRCIDVCDRHVFAFRARTSAEASQPKAEGDSL